MRRMINLPHRELDLALDGLSATPHAYCASLRDSNLISGLHALLHRIFVLGASLRSTCEGKENVKAIGLRNITLLLQVGLAYFYCGPAKFHANMKTVNLDEIGKKIVSSTLLTSRSQALESERVGASTVDIFWSSWDHNKCLAAEGTISSKQIHIYTWELVMPLEWRRELRPLNEASDYG